VYSEDRTQNYDPEKKTIGLYYSACYIVFYKLNKTHKSRLNYEIKCDLYTIAHEKDNENPKNLKLNFLRGF